MVRLHPGTFLDVRVAALRSEAGYGFPMPTAIINQPNLRVHLVGERLEVRGLKEESDREEVLREIPIRDLDRLIISESVHLTTAALAEVMRRAIPVQVFSWSGAFLGGFLPAQNHHGLCRLNQYRKTLDPEFGLLISKRIITAKVYNQRRVLQRLTASRLEQSVEPGGGGVGADPEEFKQEMRRHLDWLDSIFDSLRRCKTIDELRGYEGASTARYFQAWACFLPAEFPFERRSTRPPLNPVNSCISFAATVLYNEAVAFVQGHGLDPALGLLHATEDGRWSLALDLIEPFRPVFAEALTLDLFSNQILNGSHFESKNGGVYLNTEGRKKFFLQYERRMERQFMSESVDHRTTLRRQLENQAVMYKSSLEEQDRFEPFLMN